jgi:hypothetical protein
VTFPLVAGTWAGLFPRPWARRSARFIGTCSASAEVSAVSVCAGSDGRVDAAADFVAFLGCADPASGALALAALALAGLALAWRALAGLALAVLAFAALAGLAFAGMVILLPVGFGRNEAGRDGSPATQEIMRTT